MKVGPRFKVKRRRRREGKTNYRQRYALVASGKYRVVIRPSQKNISVQVISSQLGGDQTIVSSCSKELSRDYGWEGYPSNIPSAYLLGYLCAQKALKKGIKDAILDMGLFEPTKGSKVFAGLKGAMDAGLNIPHSDKVIPDEDRIYGGHIVDLFKKINTQNNMFTKMSSKFDINKFSDHIKHVKENINAKFAV